MTLHNKVYNLINNICMTLVYVTPHYEQPEDSSMDPT
jgi:hypothetical protein